MNELQIGQPAPEFSLPADDGSTVSTESIRGRRAVLYFYPKDRTPGCTLEAQAFRRHAAAFAAAGYDIYGISRDSIASHCRFIEKEDLNFRLLSDEDGTMCRAFDVLRRPHKDGSMGIERSTFIVDEAGNLLKIYRQVRAKGHVESLMEELAVKGE